MPTTQTEASEAIRHTSSGGRLVAADGRELLLRDVRLRVDAGGGIARAVLEQHFANPYETPLAITYQLPLPADGAVSAFAFRIGEERVEGVIDRREAARERYEAALVEGRTAAILDQERSSLFTQEIGNVPPRTDVVAEITIDQKLRWLVGEGSWEWRFPTVVAPRYLGAEGRVVDAARVTVDVTEAPPPAAIAFALAVRDALTADSAPHSPSHAIRSAACEGGVEVSLVAASGAALDRDVVVRWDVATSAIATRIEVARPPLGDAASRSGYALLTLLPPVAAKRARPRDLVVLLDASGSMMGRPIEQAKAVTAALVGSLDDADSIELIAFAMHPLRFHAHPEMATAELRREALAWIDKLDAGGGTEMDRAVTAALEPLRDGAQRHVVLVTDGQIGFEQEVVGSVLYKLPRGSRLHAVGIGPAVNRSLTAPAARAGRGVELLIGFDEDGTLAAQRLLAHFDVPVATEIEVAGSALRSHAPTQLHDLALGAPVLIALELNPAGGDLVVRGDGFETRFDISAIEAGTGNAALAKLFARELVEDLEMRAAAGEVRDDRIERVGLEFAIATRLTSWVAVTGAVTVKPVMPRRRIAIPQAPAERILKMTFGLSSIGSSAREELQDREIALERERQLSARLLRRSRHPSRRAAERSGHRSFRGRVVARSSAGIVIEFQVEEHELNWNPTGTASLELGRLRLEVTARVDPEASTAPGRIQPGEIVRLVVVLKPAFRGPIRSLRIESAGTEILLEFEP